MIHPQSLQLQALADQPNERQLDVRPKKFHVITDSVSLLSS